MILNCPECGHVVSDKAPVCPGCGVEIAGHVRKCNHCGNFYLDEQTVCPHCQKSTLPTASANPLPSAPTQPERPIVVKPIVEVVEEPTVVNEHTSNVYDHSATGPSPTRAYEPEPVYHDTKQQIVVEEADEEDDDEEESHSKSIFVISFLIAAVILATLLYFYKDATDRQLANQEAETAKTDSIEKATENDREPAEATTVMTTATDTIKPQVVEAKTDPQKEEVKEVKEEKKESAETDKTQNTTISENEKQKAFMAVRRFFQAVNSKNEGNLRASTTDILTSFKGKSNASKMDVIGFMKDLYQADVTNLNWHLSPVTSAKKLEKDNQKAEYRITLPARRVIERGDVKSERHFTVTATVTSDGKVKAMEFGNAQ